MAETQSSKLETGSMVEKTYYELNLPLAGFDADLLSGFLHRAGCLGIQETEEGRWIVYLPGNWSAEHIRNLLRELQRLAPGFDPDAVQFEKLPFRDWNAEWRKHFEPFPAAKDCWIRPPWQELPEGSTGVEIIIDPQMAFGTGHHETTRLMLQAMPQLELQGKTVLDLGTGSGILAIYAAKLGARQVIAIDNDPEAIANAEHNASLNNVDRIDFRLGDISLLEGRSFDAILANIQFNVLSELALPFSHHLAPGGKLLISGILKEEVARLSYLYKHAGFLEAERFFMNEWAAIYVSVRRASCPSQF